MVRHERILLAILGSTSVLTAVALIVVVLAVGGLAFRQLAVPGQAERTFRAAGASAFAAFLAGVLSIVLNVWWLIQQHNSLYALTIVSFVLQLALLTLAAAQAFTQAISRKRPRSPAGGDVNAGRTSSSGQVPRPGQ
jgi:cytochrome bd-type quinol oxidase subunit 2